MQLDTPVGLSAHIEGRRLEALALPFPLTALLRQEDEGQVHWG